ncbi:MAG TPA: hypothetical protein VHX65_07320 [Pirellulales bacterium]|jgi:hypothetical protein|nr:hypothetical protein [Pirellulales bacterium]
MDDSKNAILVSIMVFCLVVIGFQVFLNSGDSFGWLKMFGGLLLATVAAAGTFAVMAGMSKR